PQRVIGAPAGRDDVAPLLGVPPRDQLRQLVSDPQRAEVQDDAQHRQQAAEAGEDRPSLLRLSSRFSEGRELGIGWDGLRNLGERSAGPLRILALHANPWRTGSPGKEILSPLAL